MIQIRKGKSSDLKKILNQDWAWNGAKKIQDNYINELRKGNRDFLAVADDEKIVGELWIFWDDKDHEQANGKNRAYLSTLRLHPDYRRQGIGTKLMNRAFEIIKKRNFTEVTIGAYTHEPEIQNLYKKWGFTEQIKENTEEIDGNKRKYILFLRKL